MLCRCRLEGPFRNERFSDFTSDYPLLLGEEEGPAPKAPGTSQGVVQKGPRLSQGWPITKSRVRVVGSVKLRIGVIATSLADRTSSMIQDCVDGKTADGAAVGDEDPPEIGRRRTNTVDRRLRLGVGWVSLVRLFRLAPNSAVSPTGKGGEALITDGSGGAAEQPGDIGAKRPRLSRQRSRTNDPASSSAPAGSEPVESEQALTRERSSCNGAPRVSTQAAGSFYSPVSMPKSGISCRVVWCGVCVASFDLCPKTGLPLTPGECLLELPRGTAWRSCCLVLEVIATDQFAPRHPGMQEAMEHWRCHHSQCDLDGDGSAPQAEDGPNHVFGRVTVGWQVRGDGNSKRLKSCRVLRGLPWYSTLWDERLQNRT